MKIGYAIFVVIIILQRINLLQVKKYSNNITVNKIKLQFVLNAWIILRKIINLLVVQTVLAVKNQKNQIEIHIGGVINAIKIILTAIIDTDVISMILIYVEYVINNIFSNNMFQKNVRIVKNVWYKQLRILENF